MNNKTIQESNERRCYACRKKDSLDNLFKLNGRWYHNHVCSASHPHNEIEDEEEEFADFEPTNIEKPVLEVKETNKTYIITSAVSNSPVHDGCFRTLETIAEYYNAELMIVPIKYHHQKDQSDILWDSRIEPYAVKKSIHLNNSITLQAQVNINPTAVRPTSGMEVLCGTSSGILPHTKLEMKVIPTPLTMIPKIITTTGAVTCPVFTDTKAGEKGLAAHHLGAILVEVIDNEVFHLRQLSYADGVIYDLENAFQPDIGRLPVGSMPALVLGDAHFGFIDPKVYAAIFANANCLMNRLKPRNIVWHDLLDSYSICHHHKDTFQIHTKFREHANKIESEVTRCLNFVNLLGKQFPETNHVIVESNHNNHLDQWLSNTDWKEDPTNAEFYLKLALLKLQHGKIKLNYGYTNIGAFELLARESWKHKFFYEFAYDNEFYAI